eukprot:14901115-Alexandrium_andersonii.AAC.1
MLEAPPEEEEVHHAGHQVRYAPLAAHASCASAVAFSTLYCFRVAPASKTLNHCSDWHVLPDLLVDVAIGLHMLALLQLLGE